MPDTVTWSLNLDVVRFSCIPFLSEVGVELLYSVLCWMLVSYSDSFMSHIVVDHLPCAARYCGMLLARQWRQKIIEKVA